MLIVVTPADTCSRCGSNSMRHAERKYDYITRDGKKATAQEFAILCDWCGEMVGALEVYSYRNWQVPSSRRLSDKKEG